MKAKNDDLIEAALEIQEDIRRAYRLHEEHRPIMLFHIQENWIYAYPYVGYKETLSKRSQSMPGGAVRRSPEEKQDCCVRDGRRNQAADFLVAGLCMKRGDTLLRYYEVSVQNMRFPLRVIRFVETGPFEGRKETVTVLSLLDSASEPPDETEGLICRARLAGDTIEMPLAEFEVDGDARGLQLLADYCYWFWNSAAEPDDHEAENEPQNPLATPQDRSSDDANGPLSALGAVVKCGLLGAFSGIVVGSAIGAIPGAERGVYIGGTTLGFSVRFLAVGLDLLRGHQSDQVRYSASCSAS